MASEIIGTLYDSSSNPTPGWQVRLMIEESPGVWKVKYKQTTDSNGDFDFPVVATGTYRPRVQYLPDDTTPDYRCWATTPDVVEANAPLVLCDITAACIPLVKPPAPSQRRWLAEDAAAVKAALAGNNEALCDDLFNLEFDTASGPEPQPYYRVVLVAESGELWVIDRTGAMIVPPTMPRTGIALTEQAYPPQRDMEPPLVEVELDLADWGVGGRESTLPERG